MEEKRKLFDRCSNLMADYLGKFGSHVPGYVLFNPMEEVCKIVEEAILNNEEIKPWEEGE